MRAQTRIEIRYKYEICHGMNKIGILMLENKNENDWNSRWAKIQDKNSDPVEMKIFSSFARRTHSHWLPVSNYVYSFCIMVVGVQLESNEYRTIHRHSKGERHREIVKIYIKIIWIVWCGLASKRLSLSIKCFYPHSSELHRCCCSVQESFILVQFILTIRASSPSRRSHFFSHKQDTDRVYNRVCNVVNGQNITPLRWSIMGKETHANRYIKIQAK